MICFRCDKCKNVYDRERDVRYILAQFVELDQNPTPSRLAMVCESCMQSLTEFISNDIKLEPGEWVRNKKLSKDGKKSSYYYTCSVCEHRSANGTTPYCPNCGVKMLTEITKTVEHDGVAF